MGNLNSIINDYLQVTGRPAATLTVDEYISFLKVSEVNSLGNNFIAEHTYTQNAKITKEQPSMQEANIEVLADKSIAKIPASNEKGQVASFKEVKTGNLGERKQPSKEEMLKFLRSVNS